MNTFRDVEFIDKHMEHVEEIAVQRIMLGKSTRVLRRCVWVLLMTRILGGTILRLQDLDETATDYDDPACVAERFRRNLREVTC